MIQGTSSLAGHDYGTFTTQTGLPDRKANMQQPGHFIDLLLPSALELDRFERTPTMEDAQTTEPQPPAQANTPNEAPLQANPGNTHAQSGLDVLSTTAAQLPRDDGAMNTDNPDRADSPGSVIPTLPGGQGTTPGTGNPFISLARQTMGGASFMEMPDKEWDALIEPPLRPVSPTPTRQQPSTILVRPTPQRAGTPVPTVLHLGPPAWLEDDEVLWGDGGLDDVPQRPQTPHQALTQPFPDIPPPPKQGFALRRTQSLNNMLDQLAALSEATRQEAHLSHAAASGPLGVDGSGALTRTDSLDSLSPVLSDSEDPVSEDEEANSSPSQLSPMHARLLNTLAIPYPVKLFSPQGAHPTQTVQEAALRLRTAQTVALGDLHGSYRKLVETLVAADLMRMPPKETKQFAYLAKHPYNYSDSRRKLSALSGTLKDLIPSMTWTGGDRKLILIGDVVGDRGPFDGVTQDIIKHLTQNHPERIVRIAGNHEHNVLGYMVYGLNGIGDNCTNSLHGSYQVAIATDEEEALEAQYTDYLSDTQLMHYDPKSKTLYAHAPIHKDNVKQLITLLQSKSDTLGLGKIADYDAIKTEPDLIHFINQANRAYQQYVLHAMKTGKLDAETEQVLIGANEGHGFLWRRSKLDQEADLPFKECGVKRLVHGHDNLSQESPYAPGQAQSSDYAVVNLDQDARKYDVLEVTDKTQYQQFLQEHQDKLKPESRLYIE